MKVLTLGTYDFLHYGHIRLFERSQKFGSLIVGVNSDRFVEEYKGIRPFERQQQRMNNLKWGLGIESVTLNDGPGDVLIRRIRPDIITIGSDWLGKDYPTQIGMSTDDLSDMGVTVVFLPRTAGVSSSMFREQLCASPS